MAKRIKKTTGWLNCDKMVVVCLFLNFVPLCKFLFEQWCLCNTNLLYCETLLPMCVFQRLGRVE